MYKSDFILFSGAAAGAEAEFGACAERHGIEEVNFTFDGHKDVRDVAASACSTTKSCRPATSASSTCRG